MTRRTNSCPSAFCFPIPGLLLFVVISVVLYMSCAPSACQDRSQFYNPYSPSNIPPLQQLINGLPTIFKGPYIELRSDVAIPDQMQLANKLQEVYSFDFRLQKLARFPRASGPIIVALASDQAVNSTVGYNFGGLAFKTVAFAAHANAFLGPNDSYAWYIAGHEFEHVLMYRLGAPVGILPPYLSEGIACCVGIHYVRAHNMGSKALQEHAAKLALVKASDVEDVFQNYVMPNDLIVFRNQKKGYVAEHIGGLFIQFLANRLCGSPENFFIEWPNFAVDLGENRNLRQTFKKHFGISLDKAQEDFIRYISETENNPVARFANTAYQGYPQAKPPQE